ncbi:hypothetical protein SLEP1_g32390 [Rubroshorea leprosula]|uniref:Uncharacterized protein n=1 Tax=Rubroshorea leprosula TaxID=152421 RepID=A0AAV5KD63_9ROSI|nr:hypothetical protein SLEP1_g32390 [Rubroshorea leprosula]
MILTDTQLRGIQLPSQLQGFPSTVLRHLMLLPTSPPPPACRGLFLPKGSGLPVSVTVLMIL